MIRYSAFSDMIKQLDAVPTPRNTVTATPTNAGKQCACSVGASNTTSVKCFPKTATTRRNIQNHTKHNLSSITE